MANTSRIIVATLALLIVSGCAGKFRSDVSSWHRLQQPSGESFMIEAKDPMKSGSLEFAAYASMVAQELQQIGYRAAAQGTTPDLVVRVDYGISDGRTEIRSYNYGPYGGFSPYGFYRHRYYGYGYGYGYGQGNTDIRSYPVYNRRLEMEIAAANNPGVNLFETKVLSEGRSSRLEEVMPLLVESMFQEFPGPSGVTRQVTIDLEKNSSTY